MLQIQSIALNVVVWHCSGDCVVVFSRCLALYGYCCFGVVLITALHRVSVVMRYGSTLVCIRGDFSILPVVLIRVVYGIVIHLVEYSATRRLSIVSSTVYTRR